MIDEKALFVKTEEEVAAFFGVGPGPRPIVRATTQTDVAKFFDVSLSTVQAWALRGMPGVKGHYEIGSILRWLHSVGPRATPQSKREILLGCIDP